MSKYFPPKYKAKEFNCIHCGVYAAQVWREVWFGTGHELRKLEYLLYCSCSHCRRASIWHEEKMIIPCDAPVPPAHTEMPENCLDDYKEARAIVGQSPKAAAALIRLTLQKLMVELGEKGKNINDDIKSLVAKGLPPVVQQALDFCRVVGNNGVHPGEIQLNDTPEVAYTLFTMINLIVEERIARPKQVEAAYMLLPEGAREAIEKRDQPKG